MSARQTSLTIYDNSGNEIFTMNPIYENCIEKCTLMKEDYIELHFNLANPIYFPIGAWTSWNGRRFYVTEHQTAEYDENTGGYSFELKMDAYYRAWAMRIYKYKPKVGSMEVGFSLTANIYEHIKAIVNSMNDIEGFTYNGTAITYSVDAATEEKEFNEVKTITYSNQNYIDALTTICEEWDTEWWVTENILHVGKCQDTEESAVSFRFGENVESMSGSTSENDFATKVYVFGSDKNMPKNYGKGTPTFTIIKIDSTNNTFQVDKNLYSAYWEDDDKSYNAEYKDSAFSSDSKAYVGEGSTGGYNATKLEIYTDSLTAEKGELKVGSKQRMRIVNAAGEEQTKATFRLRCTQNQGASTNQPPISELVFKCTMQEYNETSNVWASFCEAEEVTLNVKDKNFYGNGVAIEYTLPEIVLQEDKTFRYKIEVTPHFYIDYNTTLFLTGNDILIRTYLTEMDTWCKSSLFFADSSQASGYIEKQGTFKCRENTFICDDGYLPNATGGTLEIRNLINSKLPSWFFPSNNEKAEVIKQMAETRLTIDAITDDDAINEGEGIVEKVLVFDDIYPRTLATISSVETAERKATEDSEDTAYYNEYWIKTNDFTYNSEYELGDGLSVIFQTGALAGLTFEVNYNDGSVSKPEGATDGTYYRILRQQFDGNLMLPNNAIHPKEGDKFILIGWDASRLEDMGLIEKAQTELRTEALKEIAKMRIDPTNYECTLMSDIAYGKGVCTYIVDEDATTKTEDDATDNLIVTQKGSLDPTERWDFTLGRQVTLFNKAFFRTGVRLSRIMGYEKKMDIPWDAPVYTIGEKANYSRLHEMEKNIDGSNIAVNMGATGSVLQYAGSTASGNGSVYLIKTIDTTQATDSNTYSALRSRREFVNRQEDDSKLGLLTLKNGVNTTSSHPTNYTGVDSAADGIVEFYNE